MDLSRRNTHEADARTRTGDPFITSELRRSGGVCRRVAGSGLEAGETPRRRSVSPPCSVSRFPGVWARIGHSGKTGARLRSPHAVEHDRALELRADDEADSRRQKSKAYCFPRKGTVRLWTRL